MQKSVRFNASAETNSATKALNQQQPQSVATSPVIHPIHEENSTQSVTISVFSRHKLPEKGYETKAETYKAYASVIGGVIWMLVSLIILLSNGVLKFLGSSYATSAIAPYIASYYGIDSTTVALILPAIFVMNTLFIPFGSYITQKFHPKM